MHLYPVTVAAFKKFKKAKYRHRTDAELATSSWVFQPIIHAHAELDHIHNDDDNHVNEYK